MVVTLMIAYDKYLPPTLTFFVLNSKQQEIANTFRPPLVSSTSLHSFLGI